MLGTIYIQIVNKLLKCNNIQLEVELLISLGEDWTLDFVVCLSDIFLYFKITINLTNIYPLAASYSYHEMDSLDLFIG